MRRIRADADACVLTLVVLLGLVGLGFALRLASMTDAAGPVPAEPTLTQVEILEVMDSPTYIERRTLVEYEDGRRKVLRGYYGPAGDVFILEEVQP